MVYKISNAWLYKLIQKIRDFDKWLAMPNWLIYLIGGVFILRIPSFFEPYSYGDEMIYLTLGNAIRHGLTLYRDIHDNKPPLLYLLAALAGNLFWFKVILALAGIAAVVIFWKLAAKIFEKEKKAMIATIAFAVLTTLPLLEGNIVNAENFTIGFNLAALLILFTQKPNFKNLVISGVLFGFAALFKIPAAFEVWVIIVYWFIAGSGKEFPGLIKKSLYLTLGFLAPILITIIYFYLKGALPDYLRAAFLQNIGYLSSFRPGDIQKPFLIRNAPLLGRGLIVAVGIVLLWLKRNKLSKEFVFAAVWILFALFGVTLSERPYPHYLLQAVPAASLLIAILVNGETIDQVLTIIPLGLLLLVPVYYKFYYYPTFSYYARFVKFATGQMGKNAYLDSFGANTLGNYDTASFIVKSSKPDDKIFVWGDSSVIYALTRRLPAIKYTASYHVVDFSTRKETVAALAKTKPAFVVLLDGSPAFPELRPLLEKNYVLLSSDSSAQIWHLLQK